MNILLIFFALPIAVIIISIALQKILKCPALVSAIIFAIFLIVTFIVNNLNFLIAAIVYAIISFVTAYIICIIGRLLNRLGRETTCCCERAEDRCSKRRESLCCCNTENNNANNNVLTISSNQNNGVNCGCNQNDNGCSYQITNADGLSARIDIIPNTDNNSNHTNACGCRGRRR